MKNKKKDIEDSSFIFEQFINDSSNVTYLLKLYVSGSSPQSVRAINNIKKICEENIKGRYTLEVIDLYQNPELAKEADLVAAPTLVRKLPLPLRKVIGDLSNTDRVLVALDLKKIEG